MLDQTGRDFGPLVRVGRGCGEVDRQSKRCVIPRCAAVDADANPLSLTSWSMVGSSTRSDLGS